MLKENTAALRELLAQAENLPEATSDPALQEKSVTPTKSTQDVTPDTGYDGLSKVSVGAIPNEYVIPAGETQITSNGKHTVSGFATASVEVPIPTFTTQEKTVTPTKEVQNVTPDGGNDGLSKVVVNAIPAEYIIPSGETTVNTNGSHDVTQFESVKVEVPIPTFTTQEKSVNPTESQQEVVPDTGKDGLSKVTVNAISSTYVGSGVARKSSSDLTATGATVSVPAGYYSTNASKSVSTATQATPAIEVSTAGLITAKATQTAGYVTAGEKSATKQLTVQAGTTVTPTKSEQTAVASGRYTTGAVKVAAIPSEYIVPSGSQTLTENKTYDVTSLASVVVNVAGSGGLPTGISKMAFGTHTLSSAVTGSGTFNVTHSLGVVPDMFLFYAPQNIASTYSMLYAFRAAKFGWRGSTYLNLMGYHGNSTSSITATNVTTSYGIKTLSTTTATITSYNTSSSYGWRAGNYEWIAIKFS